MLADVEITDESPDLVAWMERLPLQCKVRLRYKLSIGLLFFAASIASSQP
jgi:hypothetical protein